MNYNSKSYSLDDQVVDVLTALKGRYGSVNKGLRAVLIDAALAPAVCNHSQELETLRAEKSELEDLVASLNGGEIPVLPLPQEPGARNEAAVERLAQTSSVVPSTSGSGNLCAHCKIWFPRPDGTKPSSMCLDCAAAGHWNTPNCRKCAEVAHYEQVGAADKVAQAAGRDDIQYD